MYSYISGYHPHIGSAPPLTARFRMSEFVGVMFLVLFGLLLSTVVMCMERWILMKGQCLVLSTTKENIKTTNIPVHQCTSHNAQLG